MKIFLSLIFISLLYSGKVYSQTFAGSSAGQFLKIEVGARSAAMGGAFVAAADDASAIYWNPAGISKLKTNSVTFSHTYWFAETNHSYAGLVLKISEDHALALSYTSLSMPDMEVTNEFYQDGTGEYFSATDLALGISYALNITNEFSMGFTGKYISQNIWHMYASAFALDVGLLYKSPIEGLTIGMAVTNVGSQIKYEGEDNFIYYSFDPNSKGNSDKIFSEIKMDSWDLPLLFKVGLTYQLLRSETNSLLFSCDAVKPNDYNEYVNIGFEYGFKEVFYLRGGYKALFKRDSEEGLTGGVGVIYFITDFIPLSVDYSYSTFGILNDIHRFSVEIGF
ncbi:MAG: PorV/PorQ family protein [Melioribacteraceae bacterium]|nr:PorV/PorQ family protein [Melioribacteraceae bacterium]